MSPNTMVGLVVIVLAVRPEESKATSLATQFSAPGDFVIGGMFAFHSEVQYPGQKAEPWIPKCHSFYPLGYQRHLAMRFAIAQINNSTTLLPGVRLGYEIHNTCNNIIVATEAAVSFLSENSSASRVRVQCNYTNYRPRVVAVVGPGTSELSTVISQLLKFLSIPMISFASSSAKLNDRKLHPNVFQTIPNDQKQADAMVQLLGKFQWNWVGGLATDDEYGRQALQLFVQQALSQDMCVAYEAILPSPEEHEREAKLSSITRQLQTSSINAIAVFAHATEAEELLRAAIQKGITGKVWIASECWATSRNIALIPDLFKVGTIIGMAVKGGKMPGFREYVQQILADPGNHQEGALIDAEEEQCPECRGLTITSLSANLLRPSFHSSFNTYKAVYVVAHALHQLLRCNGTSRTCDTNQEVFPWQAPQYPWYLWIIDTLNTKSVDTGAHLYIQMIHDRLSDSALNKCNFLDSSPALQLLQETARVNFTLESEEVYFNETGNPPTGYDLVFWDWLGQPEEVVIGSYDALRDSLSISESKIRWRTKTREPPISRCTQACKPGQKRWLRGEYNCCYQCEDCPAGSFQDPQSPNTCTPCAAHQWSLRQSTTCQERVLNYLEVTDLLSVIIVVLTALALAHMAIVTAILAKHWDTPAIRYIGGTPTLSLVLSLTVFCGSFVLFVVQPSSWVCKLRQPLFFVSFTGALATLLGKAVQSSGLVRALPRAWLRENPMGLSLLLNTALQTLLCVVWFQHSPPFLEENTELERTILLQCQDSRFPGFGLLLAYDYCLAVVCYACSQAGQDSGRKKYATKSISFAMILILIIWALFAPAYATSQGKFVATFQVFAGLASTFAIHSSFCYPVCYILLFAPHQNTDAHFGTSPPPFPAGKKPDAAESN